MTDRGAWNGARKLVLLIVALAGLISAILVHQRLSSLGREYYTNLSPGFDVVLGPGAPRNPRGLQHCDMEACIRELAGYGADGGVNVGACDVFLHKGGVAIAGFLAFLQVYFLFLLLAFLTVGLVPRRCKKPLLLSWSLFFLMVAMPMRPALWLVQFALAVWFLASLPLTGRWRAILVSIATICFYATVGRAIVQLSAAEFFSLSRLSVPPFVQQFLASLLPSQLGSLRDVLLVAHLGDFGAARMQDQGFPYLFLAMAFLLKQFRRVLWLTYDLWTGRVVRVPPLDFALYFLGLPALIGNAATPSLRAFIDSQDHGRDIRLSDLAGARTIAACLGLATVSYVTIAMLGYSPAVRLLFPRCDLSTAGPGVIWFKLLVTYVIQYLFLLATEQASIGVARLFGYGLRDNYRQPFASSSIADFWRRWNIYFREYHVAVTFMPVALFLARWQGEQRRWHVAAASCATFLGTLVLNILPLALLAAFSGSSIYVPRPFSQGSEVADRNLVQVIEWARLVPSLAVYYCIEGLAVALTLMYEFRRPHRQSERRSWKGRVVWMVGIAASFAFIGALRCFLDDDLSLSQQLLTLGRALGLTRGE